MCFNLRNKQKHKEGGKGDYPRLTLSLMSRMLGDIDHKGVKYMYIYIIYDACIAKSIVKMF